jgi:hypothetical protein
MIIEMVKAMTIFMVDDDNRNGHIHHGYDHMMDMTISIIINRRNGH